MSLTIYLIGFVIVIAGLAWGLVTAGVSTLYVAIACTIFLGIGILTGATRMRAKDPA